MRTLGKAAILLFAGMLALAACGGDAPRFKSSDVTGAGFGRSFSLVDHTGKPRTLADFRGKAVVMFFGYTQCPDVCPTTLADLASAMKKLGPDASQVQVLFVTVDPKRDKPELLREYLPAFDKSFLGLYGDAEATKKVEGDFKIYAAERPGKTPESYTVDHAAQTFVFDRQGKVRLVMGYGMAPESIASDVKVLLN
jgi:protein SCO1/2